MRWNTNQRFAFIETLLYWEGQINRKDLEAFFKISAPVASADFKHYMETAPNNMIYDRSEKVYKATPEFTPRFISTDPYDYFFLLRLSRNERFQPYSFLRNHPNFQVLSFPERKVDPEILKRVVRVIKEKKALEIHYQSMSTPEPHWRWITPHSFGFDGFRWHIRAFCHMRKDFRDFVFGRILDTGEERPHTIDANLDLLWHATVVFKIAPHPELSENQRKMVVHEYGMKNGQKQFEVSAAFGFYVINRLRLDVDEKKSIILLNKEEIDASINEIKARQQKILADMHSRLPV